MHTGIDISAPIGTGVKATGDGIVMYANWNIGQSSAALNEAGTSVNTALGGRAAFKCATTGWKSKQCGQP